MHWEPKNNGTGNNDIFATREEKEEGIWDFGIWL
jgi:hypothetical protein